MLWLQEDQAEQTLAILAGFFYTSGFISQTLMSTIMTHSMFATFPSHDFQNSKYWDDIHQYQRRMTSFLFLLSPPLPLPLLALCGLRWFCFILSSRIVADAPLIVASVLICWYDEWPMSCLIKWSPPSLPSPFVKNVCVDISCFCFGIYSYLVQLHVRLLNKYISLRYTRSRRWCTPTSKQPKHDKISVVPIVEYNTEYK